MEERHQEEKQRHHAEQEMSKWYPGVEQAPASVMSLPPPFRDSADNDENDDDSSDNSEVFYDAFFDEPSGSSMQEMATPVPPRQPQHLVNSLINGLRNVDRDMDYVEQTAEEETYERLVYQDDHNSREIPEESLTASQPAVTVSERLQPSRAADNCPESRPDVIQEDMDGSASSHDEKPKFRAAQNTNRPSNTHSSAARSMNDSSRISTVSMASFGSASQNSFNSSRNNNGLRVSFEHPQEQSSQRRRPRMKAQWEDSSAPRVSSPVMSDASGGKANSQEDSSLGELGSDNSYDDNSDYSSSTSSEGAAQPQNPTLAAETPRPTLNPAEMDRATMLADESKRRSGRRLRALMALKEASHSVRDITAGKDAFNLKTVVRQSRQIDMETGAKSTREFTAQRVTDQEYLQPMDPRQRRKRMFLRKQKEKLGAELDKSRHGLKFRKSSALAATARKSQSLGLGLGDDLDDESIVQYRLSSMIAKDDNSFYKDNFHLLREYLYWCLRKSFLAVLVTESVIFLTWCWLFAILYYILGKLNPQCIVGSNGLDFEEGNMGFVDAFTLSWTTFSTVGYGHIHPAIYSEGANTRCAFVTMLASWQSFVGVQAASFCSAIIFAKIAKTQSIAHVAFSDNVVIRFGQELVKGAAQGSTKNCPPDFHDSMRAGLGDIKTISKFPSPILEFRVVNLLHHEKGGEVMNCKVNVVASSLEEVSNLDSKDTRSGFMDAVLPSKQVVKGMKKLQKIKKSTIKKVHTSGKMLTNRGSIIQKVNRTITDFTATRHESGDDSENGDAEAEPYKEDGDSDDEFPDLGFAGLGLGDEYEVDAEIPPDDGGEKPEPKLKRRWKERTTKEPKNKTTRSKRNTLEDEINNPLMNRSASIFVDEEPFEGPRRVFSKIELETDSHPFFKRVWVLRHKLNEDSPLLNTDARRLVKANGGFWPASMCSVEVIKSCLEMSQLIVTMSGTAVVSGSSVYKLHVYELDQAEIGRTFEDALAVGQNGKLTVDLSLLSSTMPQHEEKAEEDDGSINLDSGDRGWSRFGRRRISLGRLGFLG